MKISSTKEPIEIDNDQDLHIEYVQVCTWGDDYGPCSESIKVSTHGDRLNVSVNHGRMEFVPTGRLRGEPAASILLRSENGNRFAIHLSHHKGQVFISAEKLFTT